MHVCCLLFVFIFLATMTFALISDHITTQTECNVCPSVYTDQLPPPHTENQATPPYPHQLRSIMRLSLLTQHL